MKTKTMAIPSLTSKNESFSNIEVDLMDLISFTDTEEVNFKEIDNNQLIDKFIPCLEFSDHNTQNINTYINNFNPSLSENTGCLKPRQIVEPESSVDNSKINFHKRKRINEDESVAKHLKRVDNKDLHLKIEESLDNMAIKGEGNMFPHQELDIDIEEALNNVCKTSTSIPLSGGNGEMNAIQFHTDQKNISKSDLSIKPYDKISFSASQLSNSVSKLNFAELSFENNLNIAKVSNASKTNSTLSQILNYDMVESSNNVSETNNTEMETSSINLQVENSLYKTKASSSVMGQFQNSNFVRKSPVKFLKTAQNEVMDANFLELPTLLNNVCKPSVNITQNKTTATDGKLHLKEFLHSFKNSDMSTAQQKRNRQEINSNCAKSLSSYIEPNMTELLANKDREVIHVKPDVPNYSYKKRKSWEVYSCEKCSYKTKWNKNYTSHLQNEHQSEENLIKRIIPHILEVKPGLFVCQQCYYIFSSEGSIYSHYLNSHMQPILDTDLKNKVTNDRRKYNKYSSERSMKTVEKTHEQEKKGDIKLFVCSECHFVYNSLSKLLQHYLLHKNVTKCIACNMQLSCHAKLKEHITINHMLTKLFACYICDKKFRLVRYLRNHMNTHNPDAKSIYNCTVCSAKFKSNADLLSHLNSHKYGTNHEYSRFGYEYNKLSQNIENIHPQTVICSSKKQGRICNQCGISKLNNLQLAQHLEKCFSQGVKNIVNSCPVCHLVLSTKRNLLIHLLYHNKHDLESTVRHLCPKCHLKSFLTKSLLSEHSLTCNGKEHLNMGKSIQDAILISDNDSE